MAWVSCFPSSLSVVKLLKQRPQWVHSQDTLRFPVRVPHSLLGSEKSPVVFSRVADRFFFFVTLLPP